MTNNSHKFVLIVLFFSLFVYLKKNNPMIQDVSNAYFLLIYLSLILILFIIFVS